MSHMDTVWDVGTVAGRPTRIEGDRLYGVGAMDMKGGIVIGPVGIAGAARARPVSQRTNHLLAQFR